jgi:glycosyltransferase involved in cell wall biosynthesis
VRPRIAVLASLAPTGEQGGAERFFVGLRDALLARGASAELVEVYNDERDFEHIRESYLRFYDLDLSQFDGVISAKAPSYVARHRNHVCYLMHTIRVFYDMFEDGFPNPSAEALAQRDQVHALDTAALERLDHIFAIGEEVAQRLRRYNGLEATVLRHPTSLAGLHSRAFNYFFLPGRLHRWKRVDLAIKAMQTVTVPIDLVISGIGEEEQALRTLALSDSRIRFVGRVSDRELVELYANAMAVIFVPRREDLGLVTLEAFLSGKPVVTCTDSGEPARLVENGANGFVCEPEPAQLGAALMHLATNPQKASTLGANGAQSVATITWERASHRLMSALGFGEIAAHHEQ